MIPKGNMPTKSNALKMTKLAILSEFGTCPTYTERITIKRQVALLLYFA